MNYQLDGILQRGISVSLERLIRAQGVPQILGPKASSCSLIILMRVEMKLIESCVRCHYLSKQEGDNTVF